MKRETWIVGLLGVTITIALLAYAIFFYDPGPAEFAPGH